MPNFGKIKNLIEDLGYNALSGHWGSDGLSIELEGIRNGEVDIQTFYIASSDPEYTEILRYILKKKIESP